ncbi:MAG: hypothetical protein NE330_21090, partial [Lentisphaeraceae bacterium]|nr:hypothetical protein [Lentisphaeraceae bacterium]
FNKMYDSQLDYYASFWDQSLIWLIHNSEFIPGSDFTFRQDASNIELGQKVNFRLSVRDAAKIPKSNLVVVVQATNGQRFEVNLNNEDLEATHRFTGSFTAPERGRYEVSLLDPDGVKHENKFLVSFNSLEEKEVGIDPDYLNSLCQATGGRLIKAEELKEIHKLTDPKAEQVEHQRVYLESIWDTASLMWLICLFLGVDWYFRRKWGLC